MFLTFVNALINSSKDLNERITVRNDFYCHNLDAPLTVLPHAPYSVTPRHHVR